MKDYSKFIDPLDSSLNTLDKIRTGNVERGLGIGVEEFDQRLLFKRGQFNMGIGHDNVGKTDLIMWYYVCLSKLHGIKHCIFSSENKPYSLLRKIFNFWTGKRIDRDFVNNEASYFRYLEEIKEHFSFIRTDQRYSASEIIDIIKHQNCDTGLIDPFNSLKSNGGNKHEEDYEVCADIRTMCLQTNKTVYVMAHIASQFARMTYPLEHEYKGHLVHPEKSYVEGGQKFANRADDFLSIHRMTQHPDLWNVTELHVRKVKETETGGSVTYKDEPIKLKMVDRCKFEINGKDPLQNETPTNFELDYPKNNALDSFINAGNLEDDELPF